MYQTAWAALGRLTTIKTSALSQRGDANAAEATVGDGFQANDFKERAAIVEFARVGVDATAGQYGEHAFRAKNAPNRGRRTREESVLSADGAGAPTEEVAGRSG